MQLSVAILLLWDTVAHHSSLHDAAASSQLLESLCGCNGQPYAWHKRFK